MATQIHTELEKLAGNNPAAYMSVYFVEILTLRTALIAIQKITGREIPVGQRVLSARLEGADFSQNPIGNAQLVKFQNALPNQIGLTLNADLTVKVRVFITGDATKLISTVTVDVTNLMIRGSYAANTLSFEGLDFSSSTAVAREPDADTLLKNAGVDPLEAARVEGLIAYSSVNTALSSSLAQRKDISLSEVYPAFDFGTSAKLEPLVSGTFLAIIPSEFTRVENAACKCADGPSLGVSGSSNTITVPGNPKVGTQIGAVRIGGPIPQHVDPLKDFGKRYQGSGEAGVYLPRVAYEGLTVQAMPAIQVHASDDGFIGFDAYATVGFSGFSVSLDAVNGGINVSVNMNLSIQTICTCNIGCGVRLPIGYAIIQPSVGSQASLKMGFYPAVDSSGLVQLKTALLDVDMGSYVAVIIGVGTALKIIGVTAWIGFLVDVVLSAVVSAELPGDLTDAVKKYLGQNQWTLLNFGSLAKSTYSGAAFTFAAPFDVDGDTMLASIKIER